MASSSRREVEVREDNDWDRDVVILGRDDVSDFNEDNIPQPPEVLAKIRSWLRPTAYDDEGGEYQKHLSSHLAGTGNWLLSSDAYRTWHSSQEQGLLWIRGISGSGKSVIAASLIDRLRREGCPVLYSFFRQIIGANHSPVTALHDWLAQVLVFSPPLQITLKGYVDKSRSLESLSGADLWRHLRQATAHMPRVYFVVDALDEIDRTEDLEPFLESLAQLAGWRPARVKVVVTSRPVAYIERPLRAAKAFDVQLDERKVDADIATYVWHRLSRSRIPGVTQLLIGEAVPGRANGLFLYAKLAMDAFLRPGADVAQVLQQLPQDLNLMYTDLLQEHARRSGVPGNIQLLILQSVTHATRPLRLLEIAELVDVTQYPSDKRNLSAAKDLVRSACGPLLEILPDETVSVVHHSLTEFLNGSARRSGPAAYPVLKPGPAQNSLALACLTYLLSGYLEQVGEPEASHRLPEPAHLLPPFIRYAAENWHNHARKAALAGHSQEEVNGLLDRFLSGKTLDRWVVLTAWWEGGRRRPEIPTPLQVAVKLGLTEYVEALLGRHETDVNKGGGETGSPLCCAAKHGYEDIVRALLQAGADTEDYIGHGDTPLMLAAIHNHPKVIKLLVEAGASPFHGVRLNNHRADADLTARSYNPINMACQYGHLEAMEAFFPYITSSSEVNGILHKAVAWKRAAMVGLLLQHPSVEVDAKFWDQTPLLVACGNRDAKSIRLLLQAGADPNVSLERNGSGRLGAISEEGDTALHALARPDGPRGYATREEDTLENRIECFEMMVAAGANVNRANREGNSALHYVRDAVVARLLLDAGADPNAINGAGETLLHTCDNGDVLQVLLGDAKTDLEQKRQQDGSTPLLCTLQRGNAQLSLRLLELGASAAAVDNDGNGVFHRVAGGLGNSSAIDELPRLIQRLHERGGNPKLRNLEGHTALHVLVGGSRDGDSRSFSESVLGSLVAAGAELEARDRNGKTPLFRLMSAKIERSETPTPGYEKMLRAGAKLDTLDFKGRTPFHACCHSDGWNRELLALLVAHGLDPKQTDHHGNTLWHERAPVLAWANFGQIKDGEVPGELLPLVKLGVDPMRPNHSGRTPLHHLSMFRPRGLDEMFGPSLRGESLTALEYVVKLYPGVDQADRDGITALHLASTHCEFSTRKLLEAGADPLKATREGLTALHLAARSRQPNILGVLLESLRSRATPDVFLAAVNATDKSLLKLTPLHYACTSGQPESVRLLLEAGATVDGSRARNPSWQYSPWRSCAGFEEEERNWPQTNCQPSETHGGPDAGGVLLKDTHRAKPAKGPPLPAGRLDRILDLLDSYASPTAEALEDAIDSAASCGFDYTVERLSRRRMALQLERPFKTTFKTRLCLSRREGNRKAIEQGLVETEEPSQRSRLEYSWLMSVREYDLAAQALLRGGGLEADNFGFATSRDLATGGFASILKEVATEAVVAKLDELGDGKTHWELETSWGGLAQPLLLAACQTESPNMDVLRALVEDVGANPNVQTMIYVDPSRRGIRCAGDKTPLVLAKNETALHILAKGRHWWQVAQALPYMIKQGAGLEIRDASGRTPLLAALERVGLLSFNRRAVEELVALGADVNAVDGEGTSCLARAVGDVGVVRLLLQHGAAVTHAALAAAIKQQKPHVLEVLLERCADPNMRQLPQEQQLAEEVAAKSPGVVIFAAQKSVLSQGEQYPIDLAATGCDFYDTEIHRKIAKLLLDHGANPSAAYPETTVMHRIIQDGRLARLFLELPSLDLEARDSDGRTLLHAACRADAVDEKGNQAPAGLSSPMQMLLDRGADIRARSSDDRTALHHLLQRRRLSGPDDLAALRRIALGVPDLVNARDTGGQTPLHMALARYRLDAAEILLAAGADARLPGPHGDTPLHRLLWCAWHIGLDGQVSGAASTVFAQLAAGGADANARNAAGETPLFAFFRYGRIERDVARGTGVRSAQGIADKTSTHQARLDETPVLEMFERAGMDWSAVNAAGESLLHITALKGDGGQAVKRFRFLMDKGLDATREDARQRTPLDVAASTGTKDILALFKQDVEEEKQPGDD